jgi:hypothetical protein
MVQNFMGEEGGDLVDYPDTKKSRHDHDGSD